MGEAIQEIIAITQDLSEGVPLDDNDIDVLVSFLETVLGIEADNGGLIN